MSKNTRQILLLVTLAVVMIGVFAFQFGLLDAFTGKEKPEVVAAPEAGTKVAVNLENAPEATPQDEAVKGLLQMLSQAELTPRDPFSGGELSGRDPNASAAATPSAPPTSAPAPRPRSPRPNPSPRPMPGGYEDYIPPAMIQGLPRAGDAPMGSGDVPTGPLVVGSPAEPAQPAQMRVKGTLVGRKPMAVVEDGSGNQRLVRLGAEVAPGVTVVGIQNNRVVVRENGKEKTLTIEERSREPGK